MSETMRERIANENAILKERADGRAAIAAIQRVRELHKKELCEVPILGTNGLTKIKYVCSECGYYDSWPCRTINALDGEQE